MKERERERQREGKRGRELEGERERPREGKRGREEGERQMFGSLCCLASLTSASYYPHVYIMLD
jgi:hypothetical protein